MKINAPGVGSVCLFSNRSCQLMGFKLIWVIHLPCPGAAVSGPAWSHWPLWSHWPGTDTRVPWSHSHCYTFGLDWLNKGKKSIFLTPTALAFLPEWAVLVWPCGVLGHPGTPVQQCWDTLTLASVAVTMSCTCHGPGLAILSSSSYVCFSTFLLLNLRN